MALCVVVAQFYGEFLCSLPLARVPKNGLKITSERMLPKSFELITYQYMRDARAFKLSQVKRSITKLYYDDIEGKAQTPLRSN